MQLLQSGDTRAPVNLTAFDLRVREFGPKCPVFSLGGRLHTENALSGQKSAPIWRQPARDEKPSVIYNPKTYATIPVGVVIRRAPGVTRWAAWSWRAVSVMPGAGAADWRELRRDGDTVDYHAATAQMDLHGAETEAYLQGISARVPSVYVVMRQNVGADAASKPFHVVLVTASPFEAQDYADTGEEIVEKVAMPEGLVAWVREFVDAHHQEEEFKKRRRDKTDVNRVEDGIGDPRIHQISDVYRAPASVRKGRVH